MKKVFSLMTVFIYLMLTGAIGWQGWLLFRQLQPRYTGTDMAMIDVTVSGNVRKPGHYRVASGTTKFEILQVAGMRPTSDLSSFNLLAQLDSTGELNVGTLDKPVSMNETATSVRLEFFFGEMSVIAGDGRSVPQHEGLTVSRGDRIVTEASSQAEISIGTYSRIDLDNFTEMSFSEIGKAVDNRSLVELSQKAGLCWYKMVYSKSSELYKVAAGPAMISVGGSGADFLVDVQSDRIIVSLMDGLLLVERTEGADAINMISGQSATIFNDERPVQVTKLIPDINVNEQFSQLSREKINYMSRQMPLNILFCGTPAVFYFINVHYELGTTSIVRLPSELLIEEFANGISTLDEAFLYGGPVMVATFVERILDTRIPKYIIFDKSDLLKLGGVLGGLQVSIDQKAASYLKLASGKQKLNGQLMTTFLSPAISGTSDASLRQAELLRVLFEGLLNKSIIPNIILADQIISSTETNFGATEIMNQYSKFNEKTGWKFRELILPAVAVRRNDRNCLNPQLDKCKTLLTTYE